MAANCFFIGAGNNNLPLASTLHSCVPTIVFKDNIFNDVEQKYKKIYHNLPQYTTLLISFTTFKAEALVFSQSEH